MSNRRRIAHPASLFIRRHDGAQIPGGCDSCDAIQTVHADFFGPDMHKITIAHDDWCPRLAEMRRR